MSRGQPHRRRWLRPLLTVLAVLVALPPALAVLATLVLSTPPGERWLLSRALAATQQLDGKVTVGALDLRGLRLVLTDLRVVDPEGELAAHVARLDLSVRLLPLLWRRVEVSELRATEPALWLRQDERGLNLARAFGSAADEEDPPSQERGGSPWSVAVDSLTVERGRLRAVRHTSPLEEVSVEDLAATGKARGLGRTRRLDAQLRVSAQLKAPLTGPVALEGQVEGDDQRRSASVRLHLAGSSLEAEGSLQGLAWSANVRSATLAPELAQVLWPRSPLKTAVLVHGAAQGSGDELTGSVEARAGKAQLNASGGVDLRARTLSDVQVTLSALNLAELMVDGPSSSLSLSLRAHGGGPLEALTGRLSLSVPASRLSDQRVGPIAVVAAAERGQFSVSKLEAALPGVSVTARGVGSAERLDLSGTLNAQDLGQVSRALGKLYRGELPALGGSGALTWALHGPAQHPGLRVTGRFDALAYGASSARGLSVSAQVPDVTHPLTSTALVHAGELRFGERVLRRVRASLSTRGREVTAELSTAGAADLSLRAQALVEPRSRALTLRTMVLSYPEARWELAQPARVDWAEGLRVERLHLSAEDQSLRLEGQLAGRRPDAQLVLSALDLGKLPQALLPPEAKLAGRVDGQLTLGGTGEAPAYTAQLAWAHGRAFQLSDVNLTAKARLAGGRVAGEVNARAANAKVRAQLDVPLRLAPSARSPLSAVVSVEGLELGLLAKQEAAAGGVSGLLEGELRLGGTTARPTLKAVVKGRALRMNEQPPAPLKAPSFEVAVQDEGGDTTLAGRVDWGVVGGKTLLTARTGYSPREWLDALRTGADPLRAPIDGELVVEKLPLSALFSLTGTPSGGAKGDLHVRATVSGTLKAPHAQGTVGVGDFQLGDGPKATASAQLEATQAVRLTASAQVAAGPAVSLTASLDQPLGSLLYDGPSKTAPLAVGAQLHPRRLAELPVRLVLVKDGGSGHLDGAAQGWVKAVGTLAAPQVSAELSVRDAGTGGTRLGDALLTLGYQPARATGRLSLISAAGGDLLVEAQAESAGRLAEGKVSWADLPVQTQLRARGFNLAALSGMAPGVRKLGGVLDAKAELRGTLRAPTFRGVARWREGALTLEGFGSYRDVQLSLEADNERFTLHELFARSGAGEVKLTARGTRQGDGFQVEGEGAARDLPLVNESQLYGIASLRTRFRGALSDRLVNLRATVPEAHLTLPEARRKELQTFEPPQGVVLVRNGRPLERPEPRAPVLASEATGGSGMPTRRYVLTLDAPRNLWVRAPDLQSELGLGPDFRVDYQSQLALYGEVRILRGRVDVLGRKFDLEDDSEIAFSGPPLQPYLDVSAVHVNEREDVKVTVALAGKGKEVVYKVTSEPPLPESEIYTLLATGRRTLRQGSGSSLSGGEQVASVAGSLLASQLRKALANKLPLDVLSIEAGDRGISGTKVEAGSYLNDTVYLGGSYRYGADTSRGENSFTGRVEVQLSPRWSLDLEFGDARQGSADLIWRREY